MDINFLPEYGKLFERTLNGEYTEFRFESADGVVSHAFIKRSLEAFGMGDRFDAITPYGYGGDRIVTLTGNREALIADYKSAFDSYCRDNRIVSLFTRFNVFEDNATAFRDCYDSVEFSRKVVVVRLVEDFFKTEFTGEARRGCNVAAERESVTVKIDETGETMDDFKELYRNFMRSKETDEFYLFEDEFYSGVKRDLLGKFILVNTYSYAELLSRTLVLFHGKTAYYFLLGRSGECRSSYSGSVAMREMCRYVKAAGCDCMILGGGTSSALNDSLLHYKKQFSKSPLLDFHIGKRVFEKQVYAELCKAKGLEPSLQGFFPAYRE
ncbi:MAG: GNAT family N-acetyltransferase [Oscillospiraceae bacterium]|jgi:hypothetical protein|nr:GNAT family N-acetyltransferase [Oscillospiraceae bacterium]